MLPAQRHTKVCCSWRHSSPLWAPAGEATGCGDGPSPVADEDTGQAHALDAAPVRSADPFSFAGRRVVSATGPYSSSPQQPPSSEDPTNMSASWKGKPTYPQIQTANNKEMSLCLMKCLLKSNMRSTSLRAKFRILGHTSSQVKTTCETDFPHRERLRRGGSYTKPQKLLGVFLQ